MLSKIKLIPTTRIGFSIKKCVVSKLKKNLYQNYNNNYQNKFKYYVSCLTLNSLNTRTLAF